MKEPLKTIGFKIDRRNRERLEEKATRVGKTPGELAREIVIGVLDGAEQTDGLRLKVASLETEVHSLRQGLANTAEALLVVSGKVSKDQAKEWVKTNIG